MKRDDGCSDESETGDATLKQTEAACAFGVDIDSGAT